ncbi:hypothetical protein T492DRAFT_890610 [Pavlovales sp. CCMP2436]|nr:hypothetical protein T492DRAFT_890610 [Pavlovales sp. CCMP2436]
MASTTREIFLRLALGTPCAGEDAYHAEIARYWPALNALLLDQTSKIYNRVAGVVRLEVDSIYEPAQEGKHAGTVVFDILVELHNLNPKAPADVAKPLLARELKRICARDAIVRVKRVVPSETSGWHEFAGDGEAEARAAAALHLPEARRARHEGIPGGGAGKMAPGAGEVKSQARARPRFPPGFRVMHVEDDAVLRRTFELRVLKKLGVPFDVAVNGAEAEKRDYALVLMDNQKRPWQ